MRRWLVLAAIVVFAVAVAWLIRFGCDDAYISFTYARSLVRGDGLTWFGAHVEGYTNFGWVLWLFAGIRAGFDPLVWAWVGSLASLAAVIVATYSTVRSRSGSDTTAACAAALLATNFTFLAFGTSGLETMLQTALLGIATWQVERIRRGVASPRRLALLSVVWGLALWTRLDSAVICGVLAVVVAHHLVRTRAGVRAWLAVAAPALILVGGWLGWKLVYYGDIFPNTFHTKVDVSTASVAHGAGFVVAFLHAYLLWPMLLGAATIAVARRTFAARLPAAIAIAWLAYVVAVGGDFIEFRFFVPVMPALFAIIADAVTVPAKPDPRVRAIATVVLLAAMSWRHAATFEGAADRTYDSVPRLATFYGMLPDEDWERPGRVLRTTLAGSTATLACNGAGAIPYYADLPTVDQLGLNDAWVARNGARPPAGFMRPGHQRYATYDYLVERGVTFVIGSPMPIHRGVLTHGRVGKFAKQWLDAFLGAAVQPVPRLVLVAAPLTDDVSLLMWYLTPTPEITARIQAAGWEMGELTQAAR